MEELYSKKDNKHTEGPSDLTIKRILAFSKALDSSKVTAKKNKVEDKKD